MQHNVHALIDKARKRLRGATRADKTVCARELIDALLPLLFSEDVTKDTSGRVVDLLGEAKRCIMPLPAAGWPTCRRTSETAIRVLIALYLHDMGNPDSPIHQALRAKESSFSPNRGYNIIGDEDASFHFLKTYSSYTPLTGISHRRNSGGGYYFFYRGFGCAIDPGHGFVENYRTIAQLDYIHAIILTHFHDDHYADFPALLSLMYQRHERNRRKVDLYMDEMSHRAFKDILYKREDKAALCRYISKLRVLTPEAREFVLCKDVRIRPLLTIHNTFGEHRKGFGLCIRIQSRSDKKCVIITGDTRWNSEIETHYRRIGRSEGATKILIPHVSTVCPEEILGVIVQNPTGVLKNHLDKYGPFYRNHLAIHGLCRAVEAVRPDSVYLSEIGEELEGILVQLCELIEEHYRCKCRVGRMNSAIQDIEKNCRRYFESTINLS